MSCSKKTMPTKVFDMTKNDDSIRYYESAVNKRLKVVWSNGKKLLNTKNTNYSYGTLVQVLKHGLDTLPFSNISSVLLLGMGAGSIIKSLRNKYNFHGSVVAVELDPVVIEIAHREFDIEDEKNLEIVCMDAWDYIEQSDRQFDLIIVDIFIDLHVPEKFYDKKFWEMTEKSVSVNGFVLFNAGIDLTEEQATEFVRTLPNNFIYQKNLYVLQTNTVIIMQKIY